MEEAGLCGCEFDLIAATGTVRARRFVAQTLQRVPRPRNRWDDPRRFSPLRVTDPPAKSAMNGRKVSGASRTECMVWVLEWPYPML